MKWGDDELALLKSLPPAEVARRTGRTLRAVYIARQARGVAKRLRTVSVARLLRRHAEGWPDSRVAAEMRLTVSAVADKRRELGLPANRDTEAARAWRRRQYRAGILRRGFDSLTQQKYVKQHLATAAAGWPAGATAAEARAMALLRDRGPLTGVQLAALLGRRRWYGRMDRAVREGWVVKSTRARAGGGREAVYRLVWRCRGGDSGAA